MTYDNNLPHMYPILYSDGNHEKTHDCKKYRCSSNESSEPVKETSFRTRQSQEEETDRELRNKHRRYVKKVADIEELSVSVQVNNKSKVGASL
jgi:flagellar biosynthesis/type III secretory pathway M-ring protein FliF/YscJ